MLRIFLTALVPVILGMERRDEILPETVRLKRSSDTTETSLGATDVDAGEQACADPGFPKLHEVWSLPVTTSKPSAGTLCGWSRTLLRLQQT